MKTPRYILGPGNPRMTEPQMTTLVLDIANHHGYSLNYHTEFSLRSKGTSKGFPDLVLVREGSMVVFLEIKGSVKSKVDPSQVEWVRQIRSTGIHAYIVYPKDAELVVDILGGHVGEPERGTGYVDARLTPLLENEPEDPNVPLVSLIQTDERGLVRQQLVHRG